MRAASQKELNDLFERNKHAQHVCTPECGKWYDQNPPMTREACEAREREAEACERRIHDTASLG
jgi:hypothetical protein